MTTTRIVGVLCTAFALAASAAPQVSNRPAAPDEWGYRPADHATVHLNPPSLIWLHEPPARTYCVQWSAAADFSSATTIDKLPFNTYTHTAPLPPGTYFWHYRFTDKTGQASNWSTTRSFTIAKDATEFPMPNRAQQAQRLPKDHPRLFMRPEDLPRLRQLAAGEEKDRFDQLRRTAERLLKTPPTPEPTTRASARDDATRQWWWPNRETAIKACDEAGVLAFVYLITQDQKYGQGARDRILRLAAWDPDGPTNFALNDEAAFPMLYRLPRAYDWAYDALTPADREKVQKVMTRRGDDVWKSSQVGFGVGHLTKPYASHANRAWHKLAECAIAFYDTIPAAPDWLDFAVNNFYAAYPVWSDDDGGWHEGLAYENGYMSKVTWWLQVSKTALDIDGFKKPFFSQVGDFALYLAPPHTPNMGFGDLSYNTPSGWGGTWEYFIRGVHASHAHPPTPGADRSEAPDPSDHSPYWLWWKDQYHMPGETGVLGFLYHANLGPLPAPKPPTDLPQSKIFHGIGVASLHTSLLDSRNDVHLLFKSDPMGTQSHGHNAENSIALNAFGDSLIFANTYRDYHGSPFHYKYVHTTAAQNSVLVDHQGQVLHTASPVARIIAEKLTPQFDYVAGDATAAYQGKLTRFVRHIAFAKPDVIVIYDDLAAPKPATFQLMFHALSPFAIDEPSNTARLTRPAADLSIHYLSPAPLAFHQTDGFTPQPTRQFPNLYHLEAGTRDPAAQVGLLTVLLPSKHGDAVDAKTTRLESETALGVRIDRAGQSTLIAFRKPSLTGPATLEGLSFTEPAAMK